jgi:hypothetical protein
VVATSTMGFVRNSPTCLAVVIEGWCFITAQGARTKSHGFMYAVLDRDLTASFTGDKVAVGVMLIGTIVHATQQMDSSEAGIYRDFKGNLDCCGCYGWVCGFVLRFCEGGTLSDGHVETGTGVRAQEKVSGAN